MSAISDPVFGSLAGGSDHWSGTVHIPILGGEIRIEIEVEETEPDDDQRACFRDFMNHCDKSFHRRLQTALFRYAKARRNVGLADYEEEVIDQLKSPDDIWKTLHRVLILVPIQFGDNRQLSIGWSCDWDEEHGVDVIYREGGQIRVSIDGDDDFDNIDPLE